MGLFSKIKKLATLGMGSKADPLGRFLGLGAKAAIRPDTSVEDARAKAEAELAKTDLAQKTYQQAMLNMQKEAANLASNNRADLSTDTVNNVVAGGSAAAVDNSIRKRKAGSPFKGVASQLGINV